MHLSPLVNVKLWVYARGSKLALNSFLYSAKLDVKLEDSCIYEMTHLFYWPSLRLQTRYVWMLIWLKLRLYKANQGCDHRPIWRSRCTRPDRAPGNSRCSYCGQYASRKPPRTALWVRTRPRKEYCYLQLRHWSAISSDNLKWKVN